MRKYTLRDFRRDFPNDEACLEWLKERRHPYGTPCPKCSKVTKLAKISDRRQFACPCGQYQLAPTAGTIFEKSTTSLEFWFYAIYQLASTRTGYTAKALEREIGVTYKTAWRMLHEIRKMLAEDHDPFGGDVEIDESWMGNRDYSPERSRNERKAAVFGVVKRHGPISLEIIEKPTAVTVQEIVNSKVKPGYYSRLLTDEWPHYKRLDSMYNRHAVNHQMGEYVRHDVHTNTIEGFWGLMKGAIVGVFRGVSQKHLQGYLDEYGFRYTRRRSDEPMFLAMIDRLA